jgi:hypothetical protein
MFAVYAKEANFNNPLASVVVGEQPEPVVPEGWVRVRVTHAGRRQWTANHQPASSKGSKVAKQRNAFRIPYQA